jgi:hypothetical protein
MPSIIKTRLGRSGVRTESQLEEVLEGRREPPSNIDWEFVGAAFQRGKFDDLAKSISKGLTGLLFIVYNIAWCPFAG